MTGSGDRLLAVRSPQAPARPRGPRQSPRHDPATLIAAGKWSPAQQAKIEKVMGEFKDGTLEDGHGGKVTSKRQALAIALSQAREITAAAWDETKHPRNPAGSEAGGKWRPSDRPGSSGGGGDATVPGTTVSQQEYDARVEDAADTMVGMVDEQMVQGDYVGTDAQRWQDAYRDLEDQGMLSDITMEAGFDVGINMNDYVEADMPDAHPGGKFENAIYDRIAEKVPAFRDMVRADPSEAYLDGSNEPPDGTIKHKNGKVYKYNAKRSFWDEVSGETASALTASAAGLAPLVPPKEWFDKPALEGPTPITVTADGRVYGHAALWGTCHTGISGVCRTPPRSTSDYAFFHLGEIDTEGGPVHVGRVTMDTGHAPLTASREATVRHYDDTGTGAAHVRAYEDEHGIVLAGALMPDIPAEKARRLRGASVSGDWRSIGGRLELVGMLAVNVPGFPVPRAMAASLVIEDEPHTMALVAAGLLEEGKPMDESAFDRRVKALTARALGGIDGLTEAALGGSKSQRRMSVTAASWDETKHPRGGKGTHEGGKFVSKEQGTTPTEGDKKPGDMTPDEYASHMEKIQEDYAAERRGAIKSEPDSIGLARDLGGQEVAPGMEIVDQSYDVTPPGGRVARRYGYFSLRDKATGAEMTALPSNYTVTKTELGHIRAAFDAAEAVDLSKPKTELAGILNKTNMRQNGVFRVRLIDRLAAANRNPFRKGSRDWEMVQHYVDNPNPRSGFH